MLTRRLFIRATASIVAAVVESPIAVALDDRPQFWGDGVRDDWPAIDIMMRESARTQKPLILRDVTIAISRPLGLVPGCMLNLEGVDVRATPNFSGSSLLFAADGLVAKRCKLIGLGRAHPGVAGVAFMRGGTYQTAAGPEVTFQKVTYEQR